MRQVEPVDELHQRQVFGGLAGALVVVGRARQREEPTLVCDG